MKYKKLMKIRKIENQYKYINLDFSTKKQHFYLLAHFPNNF